MAQPPILKGRAVFDPAEVQKLYALNDAEHLLDRLTVEVYPEDTFGEPMEGEPSVAAAATLPSSPHSMLTPRRIGRVVSLEVARRGGSGQVAVWPGGQARLVVAARRLG